MRSLLMLLILYIEICSYNLAPRRLYINKKTEKFVRRRNCYEKYI